MTARWLVVGSHGMLGTDVMAALAGRDATIVEASDFAQGLSASLRAGLAAATSSAAVVAASTFDVESKPDAYRVVITITIPRATADHGDAAI